MSNSSDALGQPIQYQSYLVRLWRETGSKRWRAFAKHAKTGCEYQFNDIDALFLFLSAATRSVDAGSDQVASVESGDGMAA